jgi:hypothetical protein
MFCILLLRVSVTLPVILFFRLSGYPDTRIVQVIQRPQDEKNQDSPDLIELGIPLFGAVCMVKPLINGT